MSIPESFLVIVRCMTFNHHSYITDAMNGFCMQRTDFPYLCIVMDDCSTDGEQEVIKKYIAEHFNMLSNEMTDDYVLNLCQHRENENCYFAVFYLKYNHWSTKKSKNSYYAKWQDKCKYVAICEGDDYWIDELKLQMQVDFLERNEEYGACANESIVLYLKTGKKELRNGKPIEYDVTITEVLQRLTDGKREPWQLSGFLFKQKFAVTRPDFMNKLTLAGDMSLDLYILASSKVRFIPKIVSVYRVGTESSILRQNMPEHIDMQQQKRNLLSSFDEYTKYEYHNCIENLKTKLQFQEYEERGEFKKLLQDDMKPVFRTLSLRNKVKTYIKVYLPFLKKIYDKMRK